MRRASPSRRAAFTLIELLMVIAIIGVLVGLIVPAVMIARRTIIQRSMVMEVHTLANAVDQYKNKYGDYPPDGTDSTVFSRHCRKLFPNMAPSELTIVNAGSTSDAPMPSPVMDPAEALVFFLGGFSKDPVHPFTGTGGPLVATSNSS
ncbi:MAG: type II secretion system protein, partial [Aureliella sp.]